MSLKTEIIEKAKKENLDRPVFKSLADDNYYSLTYFGYEYVKPMYSNTFRIKVKNIKSSDLLLLKKVFKSPYFINADTNEIYHFDEFMHIQHYLYKDNLTDMLKAAI